MKFGTSSVWWKQWIKPNRLIPLLTILGAGIAIVLSFIGVGVLSIAESIIIVLLALLAADALIERISVLERIEAKLSNFSRGHSLISKTEIPKIDEQAAYASEICIIGVSAISLLTQDLGFFEKKVRNGCKIRAILLDPESPSLQTWNLINKIPTPSSDIEKSLMMLKEITQNKGTKGKCEVHLSPVFLPFAMFAVDIKKENGSMVIAYYSYKKMGVRPHVFLTSSEDSKWFNAYREQFELAWSNSTPWVS